MTEKVDDFKVLVGLCDTIGNPLIRKFTYDQLTTNTPEYFKTVPASSSGKYHPEYALGVGGLVRHTIAALMFINFMLELKFWQTGEADQAGLYLSDDDKDRMRSAIILHDTRKAGSSDAGNKADYRDHELQARDSVNKALRQSDSRVGDIIAAHMGQWGAKKPANLQEILVHLADYLASRKCIIVDTN